MKLEKTIIYIQGKDKPGIISSISKKINQCNGNIEISKMIRLESFFNMIILVSISSKDLANLKECFNLIKSDLFIRINTSEIKSTPINLYSFTLKGADTIGLIYNFTDYLSDKNINIDHLETEIKNAPITGHPLFFLTGILNIPKEINIEKLSIELIKLSEKYNVAVKLKSLI